MPDPNASSNGALDSPERRGAMRRLAMTTAGAMTASLLPGVARPGPASRARRCSRRLMACRAGTRPT